MYVLREKLKLSKGYKTLKQLKSDNPAYAAYYRWQKYGTGFILYTGPDAIATVTKE